MNTTLAIGLVTFAAIIEMVLIVTACCRKNITKKPERYILLLFCSVFVMLISDVGVYAVQENPEYLVFHKILWILDYTAVLSCVLFLHLYLVSYIGQKKLVPTALNHVIYGVCGIMFVLWVISMFNGMLYRFDENSRVIYTDWYIISQFGVVVTMLIDGVIILKNHKVMGMRDTLSWLSYIVLSGIMIALEEKYECVPLYLTITICTLIIYTMISLDQDRRIAEHKLEISESNVRIMLSQIQPHFLYNSLTAIAQLCENDPHKAKEATISFSRYLRMNMDSLNEHDVIPFEKELEHVKTYCSIEQLRFGNKLNVVYDIKTKDFDIPVLSVQPIVENAVKHGVGQKPGGGTVVLSTAEYDNRIEIIISDDGVGFDPEAPSSDARSHIGIANIRKRLSALCDGTIDIHSRPGDGTRVVITLKER